MTPDELRMLKAARPFQPFRIALKDRRTVDVLSDELILPLGAGALFGIPPVGATEPFSERTVRVLLSNVTHYQPLNVPALTGGET